MKSPTSTASSSSGASMASRLPKLSKSELLKRDVFGRTILHVLVLAGRYDLLRCLLRNPEAKYIINVADYENGWNILHYIFYHKELTCFKVVLEFLKNNSSTSTIVVANNQLIYDLLKAKDRDRLTPLQLLQNDFKDLIWIPEYVNERDEYHFTYRFEHPKSVDAAEGESNPEELEKQSKERDNIKKRFVRNIPNDWWSTSRGGSDLIMLGSNKNNNLGVGDSTDRSMPSRISHDYFKSFKNVNENSVHDLMAKPRFRKVKISKYHSIVLTQDGEVYSCGIGSRGRLGHGFSDLSNSFRFKKIDYFSGDHDEAFKQIKDVAISDNHSMAVTANGSIFTWGYNNHYQLGFHSSSASNSNTASTKDSFEPFEAIPQEVLSGDLKSRSLPLKGMAISNNHSIVYTKNAIYFWGLITGQVGSYLNSTDAFDYKVNGLNYKGYFQAQPKELPFNDDIKLVETCDTCTCLVTSNNVIHVYYQYQHAKLPRIPTKGNEGFDRFKPSKLTKAQVVKKVSMKTNEFIFFLLESGDVVSFSISNNATTDFYKACRTGRFSWVWKAYDKNMCAIDIDVSYDGSIVLCTRNGSVFIKCPQSGNKSRKKSMSESTLSIPLTKNKFKKVDNLCHVIRVSCDNTFSSFSFIKDDVDSIPLKLQKNDFFVDMEYLSELQDTDLYRKQDQLLDVDHDINSYISNFLYPIKNEARSINELRNFSFISPEDEEEEETELLMNGFTSSTKVPSMLDKLHSNFSDRHNRTKNKRTKTKSTYQHFDEKRIQSLKDLLKSDESFLAARYDSSLASSDKGYNVYIKFESQPNIAIGIHKQIFEKRSSFCNTIFTPSNPNEYFIDENIEGRYDPDSKTLIFTSDVSVKAVLILVHFVYTNSVLRVWDDFPSGLTCPPDIRKIKRDFESLTKVFCLSDLFGKFSNDAVYLDKFGSLLEGSKHCENDGDVKVVLKDGELHCHSSVLIARSAFFETILSNRWDTTIEDQHELDESEKLLNFDNLSVAQFEIILKHLYGTSDLDLFDHLTASSIGVSDPDELVNFLLDMIQISDELLLFPLKNLCQLVIKDLVNIENVMVLLVHADMLSAPKLFMNCCWFIYNNLELVLLDISFSVFEFDLLHKLQKQIKLFQNCQHEDFILGDKGEINLKYISNYFEDHSTKLIEEFVNDTVKFNEHFMSDAKGFCSFEPLVDLKYDSKTSYGDLSKKRSGRKSSSSMSRSESMSNNNNNDLDAFRKSSVPLGAEVSGDHDAMSNESAVEDSADDFETVVKRSKSRVASTGPSPTSSRAPSVVKSKAENTIGNNAIGISRGSSSLYGSTNSSTTDFTRSASSTQATSSSSSTSIIPLRTSISAKAGVPTIGQGLSPHSNWAERSAGTSILKDTTPKLGTDRKSSFEQLGDSGKSKATPKLKMGPSSKLSQKERKRLAMQDALGSSSNGDQKSSESSNGISPWGMTKSATSPPSTFPVKNGSVTDLPVLGGAETTKSRSKLNPKLETSKTSSIVSPAVNSSSRKDPLVTRSSASSIVNAAISTPINKVYSTPTLTEMMIRESLKLEDEERQEREQKSLQEIQQEQEFAKWWEEEAAKVQQQMSSWSFESGTDSSGSTGTNKSNKSVSKGRKKSSSGQRSNWNGEKQNARNSGGSKKRSGGGSNNQTP